MPFMLGQSVNVEVQKTGSESSLSLLRRFSKRVQGSGVLNRVRRLRYKTRNQSPQAKDGDSQIH